MGHYASRDIYLNPLTIIIALNELLYSLWEYEGGPQVNIMERVLVYLLDKHRHKDRHYRLGSTVPEWCGGEPRNS